jgi:CheY-like chemotaxis protein
MKRGKTQRPRILVVDDKQIIALTLSAILEIAGYEVETAFNAKEAVDKAAIFHPNLLLSDITLGAMNGIDAAVQITATLPECKVLFLTGHASMSDILKSPPPEHLVYSLMSKPAHVPDLLNAIAYMLPAATAVSDPPVAEIEHDPMHLHSLARAALARLDARRLERPNRPSQAPEIGRAAGGTRQRPEMADRPSTLAANGEGWFDSHRPPVDEAQRVRPLVRATSLA